MDPNPSDSPATRLSPEDFARLAAIIEGALGVRMPPSKRLMLQSRVVRRARALGLESVDAYCARLLRDPRSDELPHLLDLATTNHTFFFREPEQLASLEPLLDERARLATAERRPLAIWSAASSRGHELWTLAMMLAERSTAPNVTLLGTDVSTKVLAEATRAIYPEHELEHVGEALRARYFLRSRDPDEKLVRVTPALRRHAEFRRQNLMDGRYQVPAAFDVVMLRNVLIYFDKQTQRAVVERTIEHLRPGGVFCTSMAESLQGFALPLQPLGRGVYRKGDRA